MESKASLSAVLDKALSAFTKAGNHLDETLPEPLRKYYSNYAFMFVTHLVEANPAAGKAPFCFNHVTNVR